MYSCANASVVMFGTDICTNNCDLSYSADYGSNFVHEEGARRARVMCVFCAFCKKMYLKIQCAILNLFDNFKKHINGDAFHC